MKRLIPAALVVVALFLTAAGCPRPDGYTATPALSSDEFQRTTAIVWMPGTEPFAIVASKRGILWRVNPGDPSQPPRVYLDLQDRILPDTTTEEGLIGVVFAPDFPSSGRFYVHYTAPGDVELPQRHRPRKSVIARYQGDVNGADPASHESILEVQDPFPNHNGGGMAFGPDGYLYLSIGDGGNGGDPLGNAQDLGEMFGKILRLDVSGATYTVPPDNPFVGVAGARPEIWAYGLRNTWRFSFDRVAGVLWAGDVGQEVMEEVDVIQRGGNYGWNVLEGTRCYGAETCDGTNKIPPITEYGHDVGCSITGGFVYRGQQMPELEGWYLYGDFCTGTIWGIAADGPPGRQPVRLATTGLEISSFGESLDGEIYIVGFQSGIYKLTRK